MSRKFIFILSILILSSCGIFKYSKKTMVYDKVPQSRNTNVCKHLNDTVVLYAIFVDVNMYHPWTEFDVNSAMDSLRKGMSWVESQADSLGINLKIEPIQHKQRSKLTIYEKKVHPTLRYSPLYFGKKRIRRKYHWWSDALAKYAGKGVKYKPSTKIAQRLKITNMQTLNEALRDKYERENVAIMIFLNGYLENHPSYSMFTESTLSDEAEYSVMTDKNPAVIAHEFLHLFGAVDLYPNYNYPNFNFRELAENYENEIMRIQHRNIEKLSISPITRYFIGWQDTLSKPNTRLLLHKNELVEY